MGTIVKYHTKVVFGFEDRVVSGGISHLSQAVSLDHTKKKVEEA